MDTQWHEVLIEEDDGDSAFGEGAPSLLYLLELMENLNAIPATCKLQHHLYELTNYLIALNIKQHREASSAGSSATSTTSKIPLYQQHYHRMDIPPPVALQRAFEVVHSEHDMLRPYADSIMTSFSSIQGPPPPTTAAASAAAAHNAIASNASPAHAAAGTHGSSFAAKGRIRRLLDGGLIAPAEMRLQNFLLTQPLFSFETFYFFYKKAEKMLANPILFSACEPRLKILQSRFQLHKSYNGNREEEEAVSHELAMPTTTSAAHKRKRNGAGGAMNVNDLDTNNFKQMAKIDVRKLESCMTISDVLDYVEQTEEAARQQKRENDKENQASDVDDGRTKSQKVNELLQHLVRSLVQEQEADDYDAASKDDVSEVSAAKKKQRQEQHEAERNAKEAALSSIIKEMLKDMKRENPLHKLELELTLTGKDRRQLKRIAQFCIRCGLIDMNDFLYYQTNDVVYARSQGREEDYIADMVQFSICITKDAFYPPPRQQQGHSDGKEGGNVTDMVGGGDDLDGESSRTNFTESSKLAFMEQIMKEEKRFTKVRRQRLLNNDPRAEDDDDEETDENARASETENFSDVLYNIFSPIWKSLLNPLHKWMPRHATNSHVPEDYSGTMCIAALLSRVVSFSLSLEASNSSSSNSSSTKDQSGRSYDPYDNIQPPPFVFPSGLQGNGNGNGNNNNNTNGLHGSDTISFDIRQYKTYTSNNTNNNMNGATSRRQSQQQNGNFTAIPPPDVLFAFEVWRNVQTLNCFITAHEYFYNGLMYTKVKHDQIVGDSGSLHHHHHDDSTHESIVADEDWDNTAQKNVSYELEDMLRSMPALFSWHQRNGGAKKTMAANGGGSGSQDADGQNSANNQRKGNPFWSYFLPKNSLFKQYKPLFLSGNLRLRLYGTFRTRQTFSESLLGLLLFDEIMNPVAAFDWSPFTYFYYITQKKIGLSPSRNSHVCKHKNMVGDESLQRFLRNAIPLSVELGLNAFITSVEPLWFFQNHTQTSLSLLASSSSSSSSSSMLPRVRSYIEHDVVAAEMTELQKHFEQQFNMYNNNNSNTSDYATSAAFCLSNTDLNEFCFHSFFEQQQNGGENIFLHDHYNCDNTVGVDNADGTTSYGDSDRRVNNQKWKYLGLLCGPRIRAKTNRYVYSHVPSLRIQYRERALQHEAHVLLAEPNLLAYEEKRKLWLKSRAPGSRRRQQKQQEQSQQEEVYHFTGCNAFLNDFYDDNDTEEEEEEEHRLMETGSGGQRRHHYHPDSEGRLGFAFLVDLITNGSQKEHATKAAVAAKTGAKAAGAALRHEAIEREAEREFFTINNSLSSAPHLLPPQQRSRLLHFYHIPLLEAPSYPYMESSPSGGGGKEPNYFTCVSEREHISFPRILIAGPSINTPNAVAKQLARVMICRQKYQCLNVYDYNSKRLQTSLPTSSFLEGKVEAAEAYNLDAIAAKIVQSIPPREDVAAGGGASAHHRLFSDVIHIPTQYTLQKGVFNVLLSEEERKSAATCAYYFPVTGAASGGAAAAGAPSFQPRQPQRPQPMAPAAAASQATMNCVPSWEEFQQDVSLLKQLAHDPSAQQYARRRLLMLESKYKLHIALTNDDEEDYHVFIDEDDDNNNKDEKKTAANRKKRKLHVKPGKIEKGGDLYQCTKVDVHCHVAGGFTAKRLLAFMKEKFETCPDDVVDVVMEEVEIEESDHDDDKSTHSSTNASKKEGSDKNAGVAAGAKKTRKRKVKREKKVLLRDLMEEVLQKSLSDATITAAGASKHTAVVAKQGSNTSTAHEQLKHLTIAMLDVQAGKNTFNRFDNFNSRYSPMGFNKMRSVFLKTDNYMGGAYFAELIKRHCFAPQEEENDGTNTTASPSPSVSPSAPHPHTLFSEYRLSIYGRNRDEWDKLATWFVQHKVYSATNKWMVQVPRLFGLYRKSGLLDNFEQMLTNIFAPLWEASLYPERHPLLHFFLQHVSGFDSVDNESDREEDALLLAARSVYPVDYTRPENPPFQYYIYFMWANITSLNKLRARRGMSVFSFRPHAGESGDPYHMADVFFLADGVGHGINLRHQPLLQYLYYLAQIPLAMVPLSNNALFCRYRDNPFSTFLKRGLLVSLGTDGALMFHRTDQPLIEEYSTAQQLWGLSPADLAEIALQSVWMCGFSHEEKAAWLQSPLYAIRSIAGNRPSASHVAQTRIAFRYEAYQEELNYLSARAGAVEVPRAPGLAAPPVESVRCIEMVGLTREEVLRRRFLHQPIIAACANNTEVTNSNATVVPMVEEKKKEHQPQQQQQQRVVVRPKSVVFARAKL